MKHKKIISFSIKLAILVLAFAFIFNKLSDNTNLSNFNKLLHNLSKERVCLFLGAVFLLMLLNWFLEVLKWKYLVVRRIESITIRKAIESVFCGLTIAVFTPNRIGEYGGRVFFLKPRKRLFGVIAMAVGAIGQMVVTNVLGALALLWFIGQFIKMDFWLYYGLVFLTMVFCLFFIVFYFNIKWINSLYSGIGFLRKLRRFFKILSRFKKIELFNVFLFCMARFAVFTTQYCLIIYLLVPQLQLFSVVMMVFILFFIQSALPSLDLLDVGVRSVTATYFFSFITSQEIAIMATTACIWFVNLIIPAILGARFVFKMNFFGADNH